MVASGADRLLDINFYLDYRYRVVESSSLASVLFREAFNNPTSPFLFTSNGFCVTSLRTF